MNDMTGWDPHGRPTPCQQDTRDCNACLSDFEQTQRQVDALRLELLQALTAARAGSDAQQQAAFRQVVLDALPARRTGDQSSSAAFADGWNQCVDMMETRLKALLRAV